jgi:hypothetical protein
MKMKNLLFITVLSILIISCETSVKNETPLEFSQTLFKSLQNNDFELAQKLLIQPGDSILLENERMKNQFRNNLGTDSLRKEYIDYVKEKFDKAYKKGEEIGIVWNKTKFQRFEFEEDFRERDSIDYLSKSIIFFTYNSRDYKLKFRKTIKISNQWKGFKLYSPIDIQKEEDEERKRKEELAKKPYTPYGLGFTYANWNYKYKSIKSFSDFQVTLKNETENDFEYVKYSVTIYKYKNGYKEEMFSRTYERNEKLYSGNVVRFEVTDLRDFYLGVDISNENNFDWNAEIIDAKPRPE